MKKFYLIALVVLLVAACKSEEAKKPSEKLGAVNIEVTGNPEAAQYFEKGLLLLHSFEYSDAREAFVKTQEIDPNMAMAYWGVAMTHNHSLWREQDYEKGTAALEKLKSFDYKSIISPLELEFIEAVQLLYEPKIDKVDRDKNYAQFMEQLHEKYPDNHEVSAFYALSLLGAVPEGRDDEMYGKGAKIAQGIIEENPNHPGALHYLIHSYDDPNHAHLALNAADSYAKVAPDASHALHMPSHIYVALGMWDEVIASNIDSYQASLNRMERKNLDNNARGYHAYHWLQYGYLQKDNVSEAKKMLVDMEQYTNETPSKRARTHLVFLKGTYLINSGDWDSDVSNIEVAISDLNVSIRSQYFFIEGMKAYHKKDSILLKETIHNLENDYKRESFIASDKGATFCSGLSRDVANERDLIAAKARKHQLMALLGKLTNDPEQTEENFLQSIALKESVSYSYGPPSIQKPPREMYGDWLLSQGRNDEAKKQYEKSLQMNPNRRLTVEGIEKTSL